MTPDEVNLAMLTTAIVIGLIVFPFIFFAEITKESKK